MFRKKKLRKKNYPEAFFFSLQSAFFLYLVVFTSKNVKWYEVVRLDMIYTKFDALQPIIYLSKTPIKGLIKK